MPSEQDVERTMAMLEQPGCDHRILEGMLLEARRFGAAMELLAEQRQARIEQLETRVRQLTAAHATAERLRADRRPVGCPSLPGGCTRDVSHTHWSDESVTFG